MIDEERFNLLVSEEARAARLCTRWNLRVHFEVPVRVPRPPIPARHRVLLVLLCFVRNDIPSELALLVLRMCTLKDLC